MQCCAGDLGEEKKFEKHLTKKHHANRDISWNSLETRGAEEMLFGGGPPKHRRQVGRAVGGGHRRGFHPAQRSSWLPGVPRFVCLIVLLRALWVPAGSTEKNKNVILHGDLPFLTNLILGNQDR